MYYRRIKKSSTNLGEELPTMFTRMKYSTGEASYHSFYNVPERRRPIMPSAKFTKEFVATKLEDQHSHKKY